MTSGEVLSGQEAGLVEALRAMVGLAAATAVVQGLALVAGGTLESARWVGVDAVAGLTFFALLRGSRAGRRREAAVALVAFCGMLTALPLLFHGPDHPMWAMLSAFTAALATLLLGGRGALVTLGVGAAVLLPIVVLEDAGVIIPIAGLRTEQPESATAVQMLALLCLLGWTFRASTRATPPPAVSPPAPPAPAPARTRSLTPREVEVVRLIAEGQANDAIAARLVVSPRTVHSHVTNAMRKCGCANRTALGVLAVREGLVPLTPPAGRGPATARTPSAPTGSLESQASG